MMKLNLFTCNSWFGWNGKGPFNAPSQGSYSCANGFTVDSGDFPPFSNAPSNTVKCNVVVLPAVPCLLTKSGPLAIILIVISIIINSVKRVVFTRSLTNLSQKHREVAPSRIVFNAPAAIDMKVAGIGVIAPLTHTVPDPIQGMSRKTMLDILMFLIFWFHAVIIQQRNIL